MAKKVNPFWIITLSICIAIIAFPLFQYGMFMDGIQYACVSKNLSNSLGTFWQPFISPSWDKAGCNYFLEHPPLVYAMQAIFFKLFGGAFYVERLYCLFTALTTIYLIHLFWKQLFIDNQILAKYSWLPVLLWIVIPLDFWGFHNNIQENTMGIFILASALFSLKAINHKSKSYLFVIISGICIFLASLCKGLPGLFPMSFFVLFWLFNNDLKFSKALVFTAVLFTTPIIIYLIIIQNSVAYESLHFYITQRLFYRISNEPTVTNHFSILIQTFMEALHVIVLTIIVWMWIKYKKISLHKTKKNKFYFLISLGLCGILPIMITPTQRVFYVTPAMPFIVMAMAIIVSSFIANYASFFTKYIPVLKIISIIMPVLCIFIIIKPYGNVMREKEKINDVFEIKKAIPQYSLIKVSQKVYEDWPFQFYLIRYGDIYMNPSQNKKYKYFLKEKNDTIDTYNKKRIPINSLVYDLYTINN